MTTATTRTTTTTEAMSIVVERLTDLTDRPNIDAYIRQGAQDVLRRLESIEDAIFERSTPYSETRIAALNLLMALENGLSGTDPRTYGVDRAKVTPLIEDMLRAIVLGNVRFTTEG